MSDNNQFSEREKEVTELLMQGKSNKQIALALGISASTVEYHLKNVYKKLEVNSRTEAVLRLGKSTGGNGTGELGKSTVELNGKAANNGVQRVSTWRMPVGRSFVMIGAGLLAIACVVLIVLGNMPFTFNSVENTPTNTAWTSALTIPSVMENTPPNGSALPDLVITSVYVSMVDFNGICLPFYGLNVTVYNRGNVPATDVTIFETNTGQELGIGILNPLQSLSTSFMAKESDGTYTVIVDPHNAILESNEANNSATFSDATATPVASCPPLEFGVGAATPFASITMMVPDVASPTFTPFPSMTIVATDTPGPTPMVATNTPSATPVVPTDTPSPTRTVVPTVDSAALPDLIIKFTYLEMAGRQRNCVEAYMPYEIRVVVQNIGQAEARPFAVDLNGSRKFADGGLLPGHSVVLHFATTPSGQYAVHVDSLNQVGERDENNNAITYFAPTPTPPVLCTATPTPTR